MACMAINKLQFSCWGKHLSARDTAATSTPQITPDVRLARTAERELAAFHQAVLRNHGAAEATQAAQDWVEVMETMEWPSANLHPDWRRVTIAAASRLASRILARPSSI